MSLLFRIALSALLTVLLTAETGCTPSRVEQVNAPTPQFARFVEPDNWWSIDIPRNWQAARLELDGFRTRIDRWQQSPPPTAIPMRDLNSKAVVYEFSEDLPCRECGVGDRARLTVAALPPLDPNRITEQTAQSLESATGVHDLDSKTSQCADGPCSSVTYLTDDLSVQIEYRHAPQQQRTYELKASSPVQETARLQAIFQQAFLSFRIEARS